VIRVCVIYEPRSPQGAALGDPYEVAAVSFQAVSSAGPIGLQREIKALRGISGLTLHLVDPRGGDRGSLGEASVTRRDGAH
jgi:hypothetical protein